MNELNEITSRLSLDVAGMSFDVIEARKEIGSDGVSCWMLKAMVQKTPEQLEKENGGASDADNQ